MNYFNFIGAIIACILAIFKIMEIINNRPIIRTTGSGLYDYKNEKETVFDYTIVFENIGRRPAIILDMQVNLLDSKKKRLNIHSTIEKINKKMDCPDIFEKHFEYRVDRKLPSQIYFIEAKIQFSGKKRKLRIKMLSLENHMGEVIEEIEEGENNGLL